MAFFIPIVLGSTRRDRQSIKIAKFVHARVSRSGHSPEIETELLDLAEYDFPIMEERLRFRDDPPPRLREFADKIARADSLIIVSPEYNHGYPGVLKNALDYLLPEYERKPLGIVTLSLGGLGGVNCLTQLRLVAYGMGAFPIIESFMVSHVDKTFDADGNPVDPSYEDRFKEFFADLLWFTEAVSAKKAKDRGRESAA